MLWHVMSSVNVAAQTELDCGEERRIPDPDWIVMTVSLLYDQALVTWCIACLSVCVVCVICVECTAGSNGHWGWWQ